MLIEGALLCLALNVYFEARGEPIMGQYAVAQVTMNRAGRNPERVCQETLKPRQFSWTNNGIVRTRNGWELRPGLKPRDEHAWWVANRIALMTLTGRMPDLTRGADHYHTHAVKPIWRLAMVRVQDIGNHRFYVQSPRQS